MFGSVAVLVTVKSVSTFTVWVGITGNTGATFTSRTITVKLLVASNTGLTRSNASLLVTTVVIVLVDGLCVWLGVQVITPLPLMLMPAGGLISAYPVVVAWMFGSVAALVTVKSVSS